MQLSASNFSYNYGTCVDPDRDPHSKYRSRSTKLLNTDPIWIRIHNNGSETLFIADQYRTSPMKLHFNSFLILILILIHPNELICLARFLKFPRLHTQVAKAYPRKPKPGVGATPFYTRLSAIEQAARKVRTEEPSASGAQPNLLPDASKNKRNVKYCV